MPILRRTIPTGAAQDERLVTPTVDLAGATKMGWTLRITYPYYGMKSGEFTFTLEISKDGGGTWTTVCLKATASSTE